MTETCPSRGSDDTGLYDSDHADEPATAECARCGDRWPVVFREGWAHA